MFLNKDYPVWNILGKKKILNTENKKWKCTYVIILYDPHQTGLIHNITDYCKILVAQCGIQSNTERKTDLLRVGLISNPSSI